MLKDYQKHADLLANSSLKMDVKLCYYPMGTVPREIVNATCGAHTGTDVASIYFNIDLGTPTNLLEVEDD